MRALREQGVGFSTVVSLGPNTAVELSQVLDYLSTDAQTQSILVYMEGIRHARRFVSALRAAAHAKPVVVMKAARHVTAAGDTAFHTGSLVGADDVFDSGGQIFHFYGPPEGPLPSPKRPPNAPRDTQRKT